MNRMHRIWYPANPGKATVRQALARAGTRRKSGGHSSPRRARTGLSRGKPHGEPCPAGAADSDATERVPPGLRNLIRSSCFRLHTSVRLSHFTLSRGARMAAFSMIHAPGPTGSSCSVFGRSSRPSEALPPCRGTTDDPCSASNPIRAAEPNGRGRRAAGTGPPVRRTARRPSSAWRRGPAANDRSCPPGW